MLFERLRPTQFRLTLHVAELAALTAAARWVAEGAQGELPPEALAQLKQALVRLDEAQHVAANQSAASERASHSAQKQD